MSEIIWKKVSAKGESFLAFLRQFFRVFRLHFFRLHTLMRKCSRLCATHWSCSMWVGIPWYCNCRCCDDINCSKHLLITSHTTLLSSPFMGERHSRDHVAWLSILVVKRKVLEKLSVCVKSLLNIEFLLKIHSNLSSHMETVFIWVSFFLSALSAACLGYQEEAYQQRIPAQPSFVEN